MGAVVIGATALGTPLAVLFMDRICRRNYIHRDFHSARPPRANLNLTIGAHHASAAHRGSMPSRAGPSFEVEISAGALTPCSSARVDEHPMQVDRATNVGMQRAHGRSGRSSPAPAALSPRHDFAQALPSLSRLGSHHRGVLTRQPGSFESDKGMLVSDNV